MALAHPDGCVSGIGSRLEQGQREAAGDRGCGGMAVSFHQRVRFLGEVGTGIVMSWCPPKCRGTEAGCGNRRESKGECQRVLVDAHHLETDSLVLVLP